LPFTADAQAEGEGSVSNRDLVDLDRLPTPEPPPHDVSQRTSNEGTVECAGRGSAPLAFRQGGDEAAQRTLSPVEVFLMAAGIEAKRTC
jgi:hypothetical protein